ncbi:hypothetical protein [Rhizobium rhizogenes]|uniref:hypothetical protein n=1 Tax=Rhizobium rhizogenes TaxID=359 RepID=UPI001572C7E6|nr:hypothetical protein [Rhizobium rhizogenes]NTF65763.1 hypothetical protein [Rhizobium rhizogenes]NTG97115.1 hypothetical protein [Rhizobium rhizogenes]
MTFYREDASHLKRAAWLTKTSAALQGALYTLVLCSFAFAFAVAFLTSIRRWVPPVEGLSIGGLLVHAYLCRRTLAQERKS